MFIVSSFEHSRFLEIAITELEQKGITKENIMAIPLDRRAEARRLFDNIHRSDGISLFDGAAALGMVFMLLGAIYGFLFKWGPIIWAIIGLVVGITIGFIVDLSISKIKTNRSKKIPDIAAEVFLIIQFDENKCEMVEKILWDHHALGLAKMNSSHKMFIG
jgi:hypothetical protein